MLRDRNILKMQNKQDCGTLNAMLGIFFKAFAGTTEKGHDLQFWRERILLVTLFSGTLLAFFPFIQGMSLAFEEESWTIALADSLFYGTAVVLIIFRRIRFEIRAVATLMMLLVLGLIILVYRGPVTSGLIYLFGFSMFAGVLLGLRASFISLAVNALAVGTIGWLITKNYFPWVSTLGISLSKWIVTSGNFLFLSGAASLSIAVLVKGLETSLVSEIRTSEELEREAQERKRVQEALKKSEERFELAVKGSNDGLWDWPCIVDDHQWWSPKLYELIGIEKQEGVACFSTYLELSHPDDRATLEHSLKAHLEHAAPFDVEHRVRKRSDGYGWFRIRGEAIRDEQGDPLRMAGSVQDVSDRKRAEEKLKESEKKYRLLVENASVGICVLQDERTEFANPYAVSVSGYSEEELKSRPFLEIVHPEDHRITLDYRSRRFGGEPVPDNCTIRIIRKTGEVRWIEVTGVMIDWNGTPATLNFLHDITDRKGVQQALAESEKKYRHLVQFAPAGILEIDLNTGEVLTVNDVLCRYSGYSKEDLLRMKFPDLLEGDFRRQCVDRVQQLAQGVTLNEPAEYMLRNRDGKTYWIESNMAPIQLDSGLPKAMVTIHDITKRKLSEDRLKESEEKYRTLYESVHDIICIHDMEGEILNANPAMAKILGYGTDDLVGKKVYEFIPHKYRDGFYGDYLKNVKANGWDNGIAIFDGKQGEHHYIEYHNVLIQTTSETAYVTGIGRDITDRISAQRELRLLEEKLSQAQKMEAVGTLAGGIAHDFNNLLQVMSGYTEFLIQKNNLDRSDLANLQGIEQAVERGEELVRRLLVFSHKEERSMEPVDLNTVVKDSLRILERTIPKMITIQTELSGDLKPVKGNAVQLEQILMNLGTNARDAMPEGGRVQIRTTKQLIGENAGERDHQLDPGEYTVLEFSDTGLGMPKDITLRIFEPFFTTKGVGKGTGLGLATVYGIVKAHGGYITCSSELGKGTRFLVYIPALEDESYVAAKEDRPEKNIPEGHEVILVVDDDEAILNIAGESLKTVGYEVVPASSGEKALELYEEKGTDIDLVVLDLGMPGIGGSQSSRGTSEAESGPQGVGGQRLYVRR